MKKKSKIVGVVVIIIIILIGIWAYNYRYEIKSISCFPEQSICMTKFAVQENDLSICDRMDTPNQIQNKAYCYEKVAILRSDENLCDSEILNRPPESFNPTIFYKNQCYWDIAKNKKDESLCNKMTDSGQSCYKDVALLKDDISICKKIGAAKEIGQCYYSIISESERPLQTCLELTDSDSRFWCYGG